MDRRRHDEASGAPWLAMELLEGESLGALVRRSGSLPAAMVGEMFTQLCHALAAAHRAGVVHRDLKPENIMVTANDHIKLIDFGVAGNVGARRLTFGNFSRTMGTPDYISPEQVKGKRGDARSDIYALGVMLYEMLTGKVPFTGPNAFVIMNDRLLNNPVPPRERDPAVVRRHRPVRDGVGRGGRGPSERGRGRRLAREDGAPRQLRLGPLRPA